MSGRTGFLAATAAAIAIAGCGGTGSGDGTGDAVVDTLILEVTDTIGVEEGDSCYVFGMILKAAHGPDGSLLVLDMNRTRLSRYSPDGTFLGTIGAPGPGPGEFQMPMDFAVLTDGGIAVSDVISQTISRFDGSGAYLDQTGDFFPSAPMRIEGGPGGCLIGQHMPIEITGDRVTASVTIARWPADSSTADLTYFSLPMEMESAGGGVVTGESFPELDLATGPDGSVYVVEISDSLFSLLGFDASGAPTLSISEPMDRVPLTREEIDAGALGITVTISDGEASAGMERMENTDMWRNIVASVGVDSLGRIWVEMACYDQPLFRVYDSSGTLLFVAVPDRDFPQVGRPAFRVDAGGILAYDRDPSDWPKIYQLRLAEL